jgi:protein O-GlcNAc transferase
VSPQATAQFQAAYQHFAAGRLHEAELACRQALEADPRHVQSLMLLGLIADRAGHLEAALQLFDHTLALAPGFAQAHCSRGVVLASLGRASEAEPALRRALELNPNLGEAWFGLGNIQAAQSNPLAAIDAFQQALRLAPDNAPAWTNLAIALQTAGRLDEAVEAYEQASARLPEVAQFQLNLAVALLDQGRTDEAVARSRRAVALEPGLVAAHSNLLLQLTYQAGHSPADLLAAHRAWDRAHGEPLKPPAAAHATDCDPERRLRIGYVSGDLHAHPVGYLLANVLPAHDKGEVEVFCYTDVLTEDAVTAGLKAAADHWRDITGQDDEALAARVREDRIDILVDLAGHTSRNRLLAFARRPAPVQVSWLGYPGSTGFSAIDYLVMDAATAPAGAEAWCAEALVRLPHGRFCYAPPQAAPAVAQRPPGPVVFGSFNHLAKINAEVVALWARVLHAVPDSRLVLKWKSFDGAVARDRLTAAFAAEGVDPDRLELRGASPHADMLAEYGDIDIALDPFPYGGGMTSAEALWMGVPVVTWPLDRIVSRQTFAFLTELDLTDLAATSADDYVRIASVLAAEPARRADLRRTLRGRMQASPLTDGARFTPGLEATYRQMWRRWCAGEGPAVISVGK